MRLISDCMWANRHNILQSVYVSSAWPSFMARHNVFRLSISVVAAFMQTHSVSCLHLTEEYR